MWAFVLIGLSAMLLQLASAQSLSQSLDSVWKPVEFRPSPSDVTVSEGQAAGYALTLRQPDDASHPALWDGPITIADRITHLVCYSKPLLVEKVFSLPYGNRVMVFSTNGSTKFVDIVDLSSCKNVQRIKAYTEGIEVKGTRVEIAIGCECGDANRPCSCSSAQVWYTQKDGLLRLNLKESDALTQNSLGIVFRGNRQVPFARSRKAKWP